MASKGGRIRASDYLKRCILGKQFVLQGAASHDLASLYVQHQDIYASAEPLAFLITGAKIDEVALEGFDRPSWPGVTFSRSLDTTRAMLIHMSFTETPRIYRVVVSKCPTTQPASEDSMRVEGMEIIVPKPPKESSNL